MLRIPYNGENSLLMGEEYGEEEKERCEPSADDSRGDKWRDEE